MSEINREGGQQGPHIGTGLIPSANPLDGEGMAQRVQGGATFIIDGLNAELPAPGGKPAGQRRIVVRCALFRDEEHLRQGVITAMTPHGLVVAELGSGGGMQRHQARFMKLGLPDMEDGRFAVELDIRHGESERLSSA